MRYHNKVSYIKELQASPIGSRPPWFLHNRVSEDALGDMFRFARVGQNEPNVSQVTYRTQEPRLHPSVLLVSVSFAFLVLVMLLVLTSAAIVIIRSNSFPSLIVVAVVTTITIAIAITSVDTSHSTSERAVPIRKVDRLARFAIQPIRDHNVVYYRVRRNRSWGSSALLCVVLFVLARGSTSLRL